MIGLGHRSVMFYVIQRSDGRIFKPARHIDPQYSDQLQTALSVGVELMAYRADVSPEGVAFAEEISWDL